MIGLFSTTGIASRPLCILHPPAIVPFTMRGRVLYILLSNHRVVCACIHMVKPQYSYRTVHKRISRQHQLANGRWPLKKIFQSTRIIICYLMHNLMLVKILLFNSKHRLSARVPYSNGASTYCQSNPSANTSRTLLQTYNCSKTSKIL